MVEGRKITSATLFRHVELRNSNFCVLILTAGATIQLLKVARASANETGELVLDNQDFNQVAPVHIPFSF